MSGSERATRAVAVLRDLGARGYVRVDGALSEGGPGFRRLVIANSASTAADALVAIALAGTLFFDVPSAEARGNVALYLLLTLAPFALLAPALGALLNRFPIAYRYGLVASGAARAVVALLLATELETFWLYPFAFLLLVLSRLFGISRAALMPVALDGPTSLVAANARLAQFGVASGAIAVPFGLLGARLTGGSAGLVLAAAAFAASAWVAGALPPPPVAELAGGGGTRASRGATIPTHVRFAQLATAGVRLVNGFLLLLLAFAMHTTEAGMLDFGALLGAAGAGYLAAAAISPWLERRLREEPMVVAALAVEAAAAFTAALAFGLAAAATLAAAAGLAWGTARFAFDGLLQSAVRPERRGVAFTRSETLFAIGWVVGAMIPTGLPLPPRLGLAMAGVAALAAQVVYVAVLLVPRRSGATEPRTLSALRR